MNIAIRCKICKEVADGYAAGVNHTGNVRMGKMDVDSYSVILHNTVLLAQIHQYTGGAFKGIGKT